MSLKLNVGLQKKIGLPDYGSLGASCHVEFEIDGSLMQQDLEGFHQKARNAFVACAQAVNDQLARQQQDGASSSNGHGGNGHASNGNGHGKNGQQGAQRLATASQVRAIEAIVKRQKLHLGQYLAEHCGVSRPEDLSLADASQLIDELKGAANGNGSAR